MEVKPDDCKEFKEKSIKDIDISEYAEEVEINIAEDGKTPIMVTKTVVTNEILYRAESKKLEEENKEKRAKKNKYERDSRLFLTTIEGQIEPTIFSLIKGQPGYQDAHDKGELINCLKIIQTYCNGGGSSSLRYGPMHSLTMASKVIGC